MQSSPAVDERCSKGHCSRLIPFQPACTGDTHHEGDLMGAGLKDSPHLLRLLTNFSIANDTQILPRIQSDGARRDPSFAPCTPARCGHGAMAYALR